MQGRSTIQTLRLQGCPCTQQRPNDQLMSATASVHERSPPITILHVQLATSFDYLFDNINVSQLCGPCVSQERSQSMAARGSLVSRPASLKKNKMRQYICVVKKKTLCLRRVIQPTWSFGAPLRVHLSPGYRKGGTVLNLDRRDEDNGSVDRLIHCHMNRFSTNPVVISR